MTARAATANTDASRVDSEISRMGSNMSNRQFDIGHGIGHFEIWTAAVANENQRVASVNNLLEQVQRVWFFTAYDSVRTSPGGNPAAAHHKQHRRTVWLRGFHDIIGQSHPGFVTIDDIGHDRSPVFRES